ncbi:MAG TPA: DUF3179 domain-containing (seleno)protein [Candidatus Limnocylindrales bacterium]|nr:DUF3179 domain-containing (seleno)protein [Candidatus Limnocylindrales bacterium]
MRRWPLALLVPVFVAVACATPMPADRDAATATPLPGRTPSAPAEIEPWPDPPAVAAGPLDPALAAAVERLVGAGLSAPADPDALTAVAGSGDARLAWLIADLLRLAVTPDSAGPLTDAFSQLTAADPGDRRFGAHPWLAATNLLIGWDLPAPPDYRERKASLLLQIEPGWEPFFADAESTIDWRVTTWGGVPIDDRPAGATGACHRGCIPALDDPALTHADAGDWYPDDRIVFGVSLNGESVALPKHIMEVHEMVNLELGGRRLGIPYCTLCASAQAYLVDAVPEGFEPLVLRTSGLLSRSNKLMYDLVTGSAFHTFTGRAVSGPLREAAFTLEPVSVIVSTWGEWKQAHPETRIVARDGGIGRTYPDDPLCGRDDAGPIFPIGPADTRLPLQAPVVGVVAPSGEAIAFDAGRARGELAAGRPVSLAGVELLTDGGGLRARADDRTELVTHEAFWFAWSQFHPTTALWAPPDAATLGGLPGHRGSGSTPGEACSTLLDVLQRSNPDAP